ncbi:MAG: flagellar basal body P-ring formation chaperone FlgA [Steroidobacteraceae bacterium]
MRNFSALLTLAVLGSAAHDAVADTRRQSLDDLRVVAEGFVRAQVSNKEIPVQVQIGALDERLRLTPCNGAPQGLLPSGTRVAARMTIGLRCADPVWTVYVPVSVQSEVPVLVTRAALARNSAPTIADVEIQKRWVPGFAHLYVTDPAALAGRHLRQPVAPGTALTVEQLAADVLVKRGQRVTLLAVAGGFEVRAQGEALADSGSGGRVRVQNLSSRQVVEGIAESATLVRVN